MDLLSGYFTRFNSTLVQLKAKLGMRCSIPENKFQFYLSSIKSFAPKQLASALSPFQFYLSSIKRNFSRFLKQFIKKFQFYLSSIKSKNSWSWESFPILFQFYLSSIKSLIVRSILVTEKCFNSTLVQLKAHLKTPKSSV